MRTTARIVAAALLTLAGLASAQTHAPWPTDWNNWNDPALWCTVGDSGNAADTRYATPGYGAVAYIYQIGKFEVTAGQYTAFLNAVSATDTYGLYNTNMWSSDFGCKILRSGASGSYTYTVASDYANRPVNYVSWGDSARFANWLANGQPTGEQNASTTEDGSYYLNGATSKADLLAVTRTANAKYVIPTEDEWYKAAYYKGGSANAGYWNYPTCSNTTAPGQDMDDTSGNNANCNTSPNVYPIDAGRYTTVAGEFQNSAGPYGTFDQGGNLWEYWNEANTTISYSGVRGGSFYGGVASLRASLRSGAVGPVSEGYTGGFRVSQVPEPASMALLALSGLAVFRRRR